MILVKVLFGICASLVVGFGFYFVIFGVVDMVRRGIEEIRQGRYMDSLLPFFLASVLGSAIGGVLCLGVIVLVRVIR